MGHRKTVAINVEIELPQKLKKDIVIVTSSYCIVFRHFLICI